MTDNKLTDQQTLGITAGTLEALGEISTKPEEKAPPDHISPTAAGKKAYQDYRDPLCREGNAAQERISQKLFDQFASAASHSDPYIGLRQERDLREKAKELGQYGNILDKHCGPSVSHGLSSPKL